MSMDYGKPTGSTGGSVTDQPLIGSTPIWETRGKKRKAFGRSQPARVEPEPRSFNREPDYVDQQAGASAASIDPIMSDPMVMTDPAMSAAVADVRHAEPIGRTRTTTTRKSGMGPAAIAAGVVVGLGALGAAGWYATRDADDGVAELTPGAVSAETATMSDGLDPATNVLPPRAGEPQMSVRAEAPAPRTTARLATARVRPAAPAASATTTGTNASATIPTGPQPYQSLNPTAPAPADTTAVNPTPAPVPATPPTEASPTPVPATPPVDTPPTDTPTPPQS